jgi:hypothetical protein
MLDTAPQTETQPADAAPTGSVVRQLDSHAVDELEHFRGSPLLADGRVNLIALDAVAERMGERWPSRQDQVYEQVERVLRRHMGPSGYLLRVSDTDFLVAQPDVGPFAAQAVCLRSMNEVLIFFLGPAKRYDISVHMVTDLSSHEIVAVPLDMKAIADGERREVRAAAAAAAELADRNTLLSPERWSPFVATSGQRVRVSCVLEPVYELKNHKRIGYRLRRRVLDMATDQPLSPAAIKDLSRADLLRIDMASIARGLARIEAAQDHERELSLVVPVSFISLSSHEGRDLLSRAFAQVRATVLKGVICEVCDIEDVPQAPLLLAVSLIKPKTLFVVGHLLGDSVAAIGGLKGSGLQALSFDCPAHIGGDAEFIGWLRTTLAAAKKVSKSVMLYGCDSPRRAAMAALVGVTHASFK